MIIYVIGEDGGEFIKIGRTLDLKERLKKLQTANPRKLSLVMTIYERPGYETDVLYPVLDNHRVNGEWFKMIAILDLIKYLNSENIRYEIEDSQDVHYSIRHAKYLQSIPKYKEYGEKLLWSMGKLELTQDHLDEMTAAINSLK